MRNLTNDRPGRGCSRQSNLQGPRAEQLAAEQARQDWLEAWDDYVSEAQDH